MRICIRFLMIGAISVGLALSGARCNAQQRFTVADEIGLTLFRDLNGVNGGSTEVTFSPDGKHFAVETERGRLDLNSVEDSLRFYLTRDVRDFLEHSEVLQPRPVWAVTRTATKGGAIGAWRWLADSSGIVFLESTEGGNQRLVLGDLQKTAVEPLTLQTEVVRDFDVRDRQHYVYTRADPAEQQEKQSERKASAVVGTGRSILELLFLDDPTAAQLASSPVHLWAVVDARRFEVKTQGAPLVLEGDLALSPDGRSLVTTLAVPEIPSSWETLYLPPFASNPYRIRVGGSASQYVTIDLQTGVVKSLTDAPIGSDAGWWTQGRPTWSSNGKKIVLPGTFLDSTDHALSLPCVAVVDLRFNTRDCVETLKGRTEDGFERDFYQITDVRFVDHDSRRVLVRFCNLQDYSIGIREYRLAINGIWQLAKEITTPEAERNALEVAVKQGLNEPPQLVGTSERASRVIWNPNPQLKNIELGEASVYKWKDKEGRDWRGGLYKPSNYESGRRYPLVIQTHGFIESEFRPSGLFPTAFAARALAAAGIIVLQIREQGCPATTPNEGPCTVARYESAARQLVSEGLVDPENIGIVGFSRSCFYVMETLTTSTLHLKAAAITDGVMADYLQYMLFDTSKESDSMIGAPPFGEGLQQWLKRSPDFNLDKINTPLMVVGEGRMSVLGMWEPYAGLRYLHKPVDLIMLNTDEHVLTNPAVRMASQGGSVDWFRFWLQGFEDPAAEKTEQYRRWEQLCDMQVEQNPDQPAFCVRSKTH